MLVELLACVPAEVEQQTVAIRDEQVQCNEIGAGLVSKMYNATIAERSWHVIQRNTSSIAIGNWNFSA